MKHTMVKWEDVSSKYCDSIILGNGASISIDSRLRYPSLYDAAKDRGLLQDEEQDIFNFFATSDFEMVLRALYHANTINRYLKIDDNATGDSYSRVKDSLIGAVNEVHPGHADIEKYVEKISRFLDDFKNVFSLNYDLIVYWVMMKANADAGGNLFKDCFSSDGRFEFDYEYMRLPHKGLPSSTLVFYPHGNLMLVTDNSGITTSTDLISSITSSWTLGGNVPLFVSEGDTKKKMIAINRNPYLNQVYNELGKKKNSVLFYGWGMGQQDTHVLKALYKSGVSDIGVSVYTGLGSEPDHYMYEANRTLISIFRSKVINVDFIDASEPGLWIY